MHFEVCYTVYNTTTGEIRLTAMITEGQPQPELLPGEAIYIGDQTDPDKMYIDPVDITIKVKHKFEVGNVAEGGTHTGAYMDNPFIRNLPPGTIAYTPAGVFEFPEGGDLDTTNETEPLWACHLRCLRYRSVTWETKPAPIEE